MFSRLYKDGNDVDQIIAGTVTGDPTVHCVDDTHQPGGLKEYKGRIGTANKRYTQALSSHTNTLVESVVARELSKTDVVAHMRDQIRLLNNWAGQYLDCIDRIEKRTK